jgi:hypothetical protein
MFETDYDIGCSEWKVATNRQNAFYLFLLKLYASSKLIVIFFNHIDYFSPDDLSNCSEIYSLWWLFSRQSKSSEESFSRNKIMITVVYPLYTPYCHRHVVLIPRNYCYNEPSYLCKDEKEKLIDLTAQRCCCNRNLWNNEMY